jgi:hypothetical protein
MAKPIILYSLFFLQKKEKGYAYNAQKYHFATYNTLEQKFK